MSLHYPEFTPALRATHEANKARKAKFFPATRPAFRAFTPRATPAVEIVPEAVPVDVMPAPVSAGPAVIYVVPIDRVLFIKKRIAESFNMPLSEMTGHSRQYDITHARQLAMYLAKVLLRRSWHKTAQGFGRDHSTVVNSVKRVKQRIAADAGYAATVFRLRSYFEQCFAEPTA